MAPICKTQQLVKSAVAINDQADVVSEQKSLSTGSIEGDDRFPGSFFRIPGVPSPRKTTWSLSK